MKARYIVILVGMILVGMLIWFVENGVVSATYIMEYPGFEVGLDKESQFESLDFSAKESDQHSPFRIRFSQTEQSFPILDLPEAYVAARSFPLSENNDSVSGLNIYEGNERFQRYDCRNLDWFDFQDGHLTGAMIRNCEICTDTRLGFNKLQGTREHVELCLGPPVRVKRIEIRRPIFNFGGP